MKTLLKVRWRGLKALFNGHTLDFTEALEYSLEDGDPDPIVPAHYEVCESCEGSGTTTSHIEPDGGGFTSSEWAEACDGDPDFAEDYLSGMYDRPCEDCSGRRVNPVPNDDAPEAVMKLLENHIREEAAYRAEVAAERRMGA